MLVTADVEGVVSSHGRRNLFKVIRGGWRPWNILWFAAARCYLESIVTVRCGTLGLFF